MLRQVIKLVAGSGLAQAITFLAAPFLSRIFTPADFGVYGVFAAIVGILGGVSALRYDIAIPLPKTRKEAQGILCLSLLIALGMILLVGILSFLMGSQLARWLSLTESTDVFLWLPLSILGFILYQVFNAWMAREGNVNALSLGQIVRASLVSGIQILCGLGGLGPVGLILGQAIGQTGAGLMLARLARHQTGGLGLRKFTFTRMIKVARDYSSFPKHGALQAVVNAISQMLLAMLLGVLFSPTVAGFYVLAQRVVLAPVQLIATAFRQILTPRYARHVHQQVPLKDLYLRNTCGLALLGLPGVLILAWAGPEIFKWVFGGEWAQAGKYAGILAFALWSDLVIPPATITLIVFQKQKIQLMFELVLLLVRLCAILYGYRSNNVILAIILFSAAGFVMNVGLLVIGYFLIKESDQSFVKTDLLNGAAK